MVIVIGGIKGGSGKTTVATNLAVMRAASGRDVVLVDADRQATATDFFAVRSNSGRVGAQYSSVALIGRALRAELPRLMRKYADVIIDTDGQDAETQAAALALAHVLVVPFVPRSFDFWTLDRVIARVKEARHVNPRLRACAFLNRVDARHTTMDDAEDILGEGGVLEVLPVRLGSRKSFGAAAATGLAVAELRPVDAKAIAEVRALYRAVFPEAVDAEPSIKT
jgi:chromosome partitioning protein